VKVQAVGLLPKLLDAIAEEQKTLINKILAAQSGFDRFAATIAIAGREEGRSLRISC
jgi:hypothetical protein